MGRDKSVTIYLDWQQRQGLEKGRPGILQRVKRVFQAAGWPFVVRPEVERHEMMGKGGYHLVVGRDCGDPFCLNLRTAYLPDFWRIEDSNDRWNFSVAGRQFDPEKVDTNRAGDFVARWQPKALQGATREGFIFMPLQGVPLRRRHFQTMSPVEMIRATLAADPQRRVLATLHPKEKYGDNDLAELRDIAAAEPGFALSTEPSLDLLRRCDYVVTENSSLAFTGYFAQKPAVLFANIDFHHIARSVPKLGVARAFDGAAAHRPDFARYLFWFLRWQAIAGFADDAEERITARLRDHGWPM